MKKILVIFTLFFVFSACSKLEDLNSNTKDFAQVPGEAVFTGAMRLLANQMLTCNVNSNNTMLFAQHWTETTYPDESRYDMVKRTIPQNHMNVLYRGVLQNLKESKRILETQSLVGTTQSARNNQFAIIEVMSVYTWANIIETFGDMPYSEALDFNNPVPKYDDALTVYKDLITRLNAAIAALDGSAGGFGNFDNFFQGNTPKWIKMANTLKLRLGIMLSDVSAEQLLAKTTIEAAAPLAFNAPSDKFAHTYLPAAPNTNQIYSNLVLSGRDDFVPANTIVNIMNALNDPRRALFFTQINETYKGGIYGGNNDYSSFSHVNPALVTATSEGLLMDYVEAEFLRAEAKAKGFVIAGTIEEHYNNAIKQSIIYWGGTAADAETYLTGSGNYTTRMAASLAGVNAWKDVVGTQAWIAYWHRGFSAWTSWRRLDYPRMVAPTTRVAAVNGIPLRYIYSVSEQTLNGVSLNAAIAKMPKSGDNAMTPLFWDVHHYDTTTGKDL